MAARRRRCWSWSSAARRAERGLGRRSDADPAATLGGTALPSPYVMPDHVADRHGGPALQPGDLAVQAGHAAVLRLHPLPDVCVAVLSDVAHGPAAAATRPTGTRSRSSSSPPTRPGHAGRRSAATSTGSTRLRRADRRSREIKAAADQVGVDIAGTSELPSGGLRGRPLRPGDRLQPERRGVVFWSRSRPRRGPASHDFALLVEGRL